eukprot:3633000-Rhodomonas_salina.1
MSTTLRMTFSLRSAQRSYTWTTPTGRNFMWATPTTTRMEPEELLRDFLSATALRISTIRTDNEFTAS